MSRRTFFISNDHFQWHWEYDKRVCLPGSESSVAHVALQCINALSLALPALQKLCLDNGKWSLRLQGLCCVKKETSAMATKRHKSF